MVKCPKCGSEITIPFKTWPVPSGNLAKISKGSKLVIGIFECLNCKARFRSALEVETRIEETGSIKNMVERIKSIQGDLMQTLKNLREKIKTLETERANLMIEIENLRKVAESRVSALEIEVSMLREEVLSLKDLLGHTEEKEG